MRRVLYVVVAAISALTLRVSTQPPSLDDVLDRVGRYLVQYETQLSTVIAEEDYDQWIQNSAGVVIQRRNIVAEFLLVRVADQHGGGWLGFRDTVRVDGRVLRDDGNRLIGLLSEATDVSGVLERIGKENARYNVGDIYRTLNVPMLALDFLHPSYRSRSTFRKSGEDEIDGMRTWKIEFAERTRPSLIRGAGGTDRLARGSVWVDPARGTVVQTQLEVGGENAIELLRSRVTVDFRADAALSVHVPREMRELYEQPTRQTRGRATYRNFRRFETSARILPPL